MQLMRAVQECNIVYVTGHQNHERKALLTLIVQYQLIIHPWHLNSLLHSLIVVRHTEITALLYKLPGTHLCWV